jgi:hypothetical protein
MRQGALDREHRGDGLHGHPALEQDPKVLDQLRIPVRQVGQRALDDLAALAIALAQQDGRGRAAIGDGLDVHAYMVSPSSPATREKTLHYMATTELLDKRQTRTNADSPVDSALKVRPRPEQG